MTTAELKDYLSMIVQIEKEVNLQECLSQKLQKKIENAEWQEKSIRGGQEYLAAPEFPKRVSESTDKLVAAALSAVGGIVLALVLHFVGVLLDKWDVEGLLLIIVGIPWMIGTLAAWGSAILGALATLYYLITYPWQAHKDTTVFEAAMRKYELDCKKYQQNQRENKEKARQLKQLSVEKSVAEASRKQVEASLASSRKNLDKMYSYNVVFPKYRNYVMVSSLYEYLCAGRCTMLEGHEGAYNILELEIRLDHIITQLDRILQNLAAIQANQYTLYSCLQDSNRKIDALLQEEGRMADSVLHLGAQASAANARLESLQKTSELTSYLAECNQRELHYMNRMNYLAGHYDNPYGNYSPV